MQDKRQPFAQNCSLTQIDWLCRFSDLSNEELLGLLRDAVPANSSTAPVLSQEQPSQRSPAARQPLAAPLPAQAASASPAVQSGPSGILNQLGRLWPFRQSADAQKTAQQQQVQDWFASLRDLAASRAGQAHHHLKDVFVILLQDCKVICAAHQHLDSSAVSDR